MSQLKTVRILGMARNVGNMPPPPSKEVEVWCSNDSRGYKMRLPRVIENGEWTRWFNLHSRKHQQETYPGDRKLGRDGFAWFTRQDGTKPIYNQKVIPEIPGSIEFPFAMLQEKFKTSDKPQRYFTFTGAWLIALAIYEGFERIELWGFELASTKPAYRWERPCFFYWVDVARRMGVEVWIPPELDQTCDTEIGDPNAYTGPLYGIDTKPELELK